MISKKCDSQCRLIKFLSIHVGLSYTIARSLLKKKDIKVNGKRVSKDMMLDSGDEVIVYYEVKAEYFQPIAETNEIAIFFKPKQIASETFSDKIENYFGHDYLLVHRLDFNTDGLIIFAKGKEALTRMIDAFNKGFVVKKYITLVSGICTKEGLFEAYITVDPILNKSQVSLKPTPVSKHIKTIIKCLKFGNDTSLLEITLVTGKRHQIRAHLAFLGYPIIGDTKYGNFDVNKKLNISMQCLTAYSLAFKFTPGHPYIHLNQMEVKLPDEFIQNMLKEF
ncbi:MAG: RluA family pseudouridine synthase [Christensenellaceae bacterium]|jgi:23S rRNA pseudouridine955/2504/2580 synthase|nr:RluA family pseudouridine synthase [Christensenellaceae bacterium]